MDALLNSYTLPSHVLLSLSCQGQNSVLPGSLLLLHRLDFLHGCTAHSTLKCSSQATLGLNPSTNHRNNLFPDSALLPQLLVFPEMACPYVCSHDGFSFAVRMRGWRFRPRGTKTIFLFLMLEKNEPVGSVHAKSFSSCQS